MVEIEMKDSIDKLQQLIESAHFEDAKTFAFEFLEQIEKQKDTFFLSTIYEKIGMIMYYLSDYPKAIEYYLRVIVLQEELGDQKSLANAYVDIGSVYSTLSDNENALEFYSKALQLFEEIGNKDGIAKARNNIGIFYDTIGNFEKALEFYYSALSLHEEIGHKEGIAKAIGNIGTVYLATYNFEKAMEYSQKALLLFVELGNIVGIARATNNIGSAYRGLNNYEKALENHIKALSIYEEIGNKVGVAIATVNIGFLYSNLDSRYYNQRLSEEFLLKGLKIAEEIGSKEDMKVVYETIHTLRLNEKRFEEALKYYKKAVELEQQIHNEEATYKAQLFDQRRKIEEDEKARQLKLARFQEQEKILHNILPINIADRILQQETFIADYFKSVSVLFMDLVGFTSLSSIAPPKQLVYLLDSIFTKADEVVESFGLEKIKTMGDGYLAVANITTPLEEHQKATAQAALQLLVTMKDFTVNIPTDLGDTEWIKDMNDLEIRIGIHTGEVVAGIIGKNKYTYDLWGDAVNIASRMESNSEAGRIHISEAFARSIEQHQEFSIIPRGEIFVKGKGTMNTFWLEKGK